jgi:hypothetical protein
LKYIPHHILSLFVLIVSFKCMDCRHNTSKSVDIQLLRLNQYRSIVYNVCEDKNYQVEKLKTQNIRQMTRITL